MPTDDDELTGMEGDAFTAGGELMRAAVEAMLVLRGEEDSLIEALRALPVMMPPDTEEDWAALIAIVERHLAHVHGRRGDGL